jgi:hypothetical protein
MNNYGAESKALPSENDGWPTLASRVVFRGRRTGYDADVEMVVDGTARPLPLHLEVRNHSPSGFAWGYLGSGPAQLALAMCVELFGRQKAEAAYQHVKERLIAPLQAEHWSITGDQVVAALRARQG